MKKTRGPSIRFRLLHTLYHRGASLQFWLTRRIRPPGIAAILVTSFASFMSVGQPKQSIFQIFCFSLGLLLLSLLWVFFRRAKVSATLRLPSHSTVGETLHYSVRIKNEGRRKLRGFHLKQTPPDPRPGKNEFAAVPEPREKQRNLFDRAMAYYRWQWLLARKRAFLCEESPPVKDLPRGETKTVPMSLTPRKRGVFPMHHLRILLPDPLGFFQKCKPVPTTPARLVVLPKRYRLPRFEMPGSAAFRVGGEETGNTKGSSGEFIGVREYHPGDSPRQIHWKSWAHTGAPMVKELEDTFYPRHALVLDTFPGSPDSRVFEEMVSVASSFIVGLDRREALLDLMFISGKAHTVTAGRGMERSEKLLEILAAAKIEPQPRFQTLAETVIRHRGQLTSCLLILNGWNPSRENFLATLRKAGLTCVPIIIADTTTPTTHPGTTPAPPIPATSSTPRTLPAISPACLPPSPLRYNK